MRRAIPVVVALSLLLLPALVRPPRPEAAVQLLSNGDFEAATTDPWNVLDASLSSGDPACPPRAGSSGVQAGALTVESPSGYGYVEQTVAVAPGGTYDFSGYFFSPDAPSGSEVRLWVLWLDQAQALVRNARWLVNPPQTSGYQLLTGAGTADPGAYFAQIRIEFALPYPSSTTTLCLDDLSFSGPPPAPTPTPTPTSGATPVPSPTPSSTAVPTSIPSPTQSPSPTPVPIAVGSLVNGGFEEAAADGVPVAWRKFGGALSRSSAYVRSGGYSGAFRSESETTKWAYQVVGVQPGQAYAFEGYVLPTGPPGSQAYLRVSWYGSADGSGQLLSNVDSPTSLSGGDSSFEYLSTGAVVAPADAHSAKLRAVLSPASSGEETIYLDDFVFSETAPPTATPVPTPTATPVQALDSTPVAEEAAPTPVPIAVGSLVNGGFEEAAADGVPVAWRKFGGALSRSSAYVRSGGYSGAFRSESETTKWAYQVVGVQPGQAYAFEGYVLPTGPPGSQAYLRVSWYGSADGSGQLLSNVDSPTSLSGGNPSFGYLSTGAVVSPADARSARVRIVLSPASAAPETLYLDDFAFSPRAAAPPGETPVGDASASGPAPQTPASSEPGTPAGRSAPGGSAGAIEAEESPYEVKISEVCYDAAQAGDDSAHEWVELYNAGSRSVDLAGWGLMDNTARDSLSGASLEPHGFAVVAAGPDFEADYPAYDGLLVFAGDGRIGNGLSNRGDRLILLDADGRPADALSYGDDTEIFDPPVASVAPGHCLERTPAGYDTDTARDFRDSPRPSPGFASELAGASATSSATPTGNVSLVRGVSGFGEDGGQGVGMPWSWLLLGGLLVLGGAGAGVVLQWAIARTRRRL